MNDMRSVIAPKSDQLNTDDLLAGPLTITITSVEIRPGTEQPVSIFFDGDGGKPYKCCKSMARVMVSCWGADASKYVGRSMTLYCDPKVRWAGVEVGGIRISHMSDIEGPRTLALTVTKGNKKPFVVRQLEGVSTPKSGEEIVHNLTDLAYTAAGNGTEAYKIFWESLTNAQRARLKTHHEDLKAKAYDADQLASATKTEVIPPYEDPSGEVAE